jgi:hypothetical protein
MTPKQTGDCIRDKARSHPRLLAPLRFRWALPEAHAPEKTLGPID